MRRPSVAIVVPFLGSAPERERVAARFGTLTRQPGERVIIVDNGPRRIASRESGGVTVLWAGEVASSYYARNAGAAATDGEWIIFCDADTEPTVSLIDGYFAEAPWAGTGLLAGAVRDHPGGQGPVAALARATGAMAQQTTLSHPYLPYAVTANCAVRRAAFEEAGGFEPGVRSGGDADLCWRLARLGWELEARPGALVDHRNRETLPALWNQRLRHGSGAAWLHRRYPGSMPAWSPHALARDSALELTGAARRAAADGDWRAAAVEAVKVSGWWAFELGRLRSNVARRR
ncbi:MAG: glycosyltransferase family 2 protein [Solirubrobacterales bacterium]